MPKKKPAATMGRPKKDPQDLKGNSKSCKEWRMGKKIEMGTEAFNESERLRKRKAQEELEANETGDERKLRLAISARKKAESRKQKAAKLKAGAANQPEPEAPATPEVEEAKEAEEVTPSRRKRPKRATLQVALFTPRRSSRSSSEEALAEPLPSTSEKPGTSGTQKDMRRSPLQSTSSEDDVEESDHTRLVKEIRRRGTPMDYDNDQRKRTPLESKLYKRMQDRAQEATEKDNEIASLQGELERLRKMASSSSNQPPPKEVNRQQRIPQPEVAAAEVEPDARVAPEIPAGEDHGVRPGGIPPCTPPRLVLSSHEAKLQAETYAYMMNRIKNMPQRQKLLIVRQMMTPVKLKKKRLTSQLSRDTGLDRRTLLATPVPVSAKRKWSEDRWSRVKEFLEDPANSYTLAGKKDVKTVKKVKYQIVQLTDFLGPLHTIYQREHQEHQVSRSFFDRVARKEAHIRQVSHRNTQVCLCVKHQNFTLKLRAVGIRAQPDSVVRHMSSLELENKILEDPNIPDNITCNQWENVKVQYGKPEAQTFTIKLRPVSKAYLKQEFVDALKAQFISMKDHCDRARQQHKVVRELRMFMSDSECTIQMDFAENWLVSYPEEPQSVYYVKEPVMLHPAVIHYHIGDTTVHCSLALVTDDRKHDASAILAFLRAIISFIQEHLPESIRTIHYATDSPSSQYRNISIFSVLCKHAALFGGRQATWTYFESGHGKGPCDGVGAAAKRMADNAVKRNILIQDAKHFAQVGNRQDSKVTYVHLPVSEVEAARETIPQLVAAHSVKGTLQVHAVHPVTPGHSIAVRDTSCFQQCCWMDGVSRRQCDGWSVHKLFPEAAPLQRTARRARDPVRRRARLAITDKPTDAPQEDGVAVPPVQPTERDGELVHITVH